MTLDNFTKLDFEEMLTYFSTKNFKGKKAKLGELRALLKREMEEFNDGDGCEGLFADMIDPTIPENFTAWSFGGCHSSDGAGKDTPQLHELLGFNILKIYAKVDNVLIPAGRIYYYDCLDGLYHAGGYYHSSGAPEIMASELILCYVFSLNPDKFMPVLSADIPQGEFTTDDSDEPYHFYSNFSSHNNYTVRGNGIGFHNIVEGTLALYIRDYEHGDDFLSGCLPFAPVDEFEEIDEHIIELEEN